MLLSLLVYLLPLLEPIQALKVLCVDLGRLSEISLSRLGFEDGAALNDPGFDRWGALV
jgi:hypothetical protein